MMKNHLLFQLALPRRGWVAALLVIGLFGLAPVYGQWTLVQELVPTDPPARCWTISASGEIVLCSSELGYVHLFERQADGVWQKVQTLINPTGIRDDNYGHYAVASADGNVVAVSALLSEESLGRVYVYERAADGAWVLVNSFAGTGYFGYSLAISSLGDKILVGAPVEYDQETGPDTGAAYLYRRGSEGWSTYQSGRITPSDPMLEHQFGYSVALSGDFAIISAIGDKEGDLISAAAYIFRLNADGSVEQVQKLKADDPQPVVDFNNYVALAGDVAAVIASGSVYIFERQGDGSWRQVQKLINYKPEGDYALALAGQTMAVGNRYAVYLFTKQEDGSWAEVQKLTASAEEYFRSVALGAAGDILLVLEENAPAGYLFARGEPTGPTILRFQLVNAARGVIDGNLSEGEAIDLNQTGDIRFNLQAITFPATVGSVKLELSGPRSVVRIENVAPYEVFGNGSERLPPGNYVLKATPYALPGAAGSAGVPLTVQFIVSLAPQGLHLRLVNAAREVLIDSLADGAVINLNDYPAGTTFNIQAVPEAPQPGSVRFQLSGPLAVTRIENQAPFEVFGNTARSLRTGTYQLSAQAFELPGTGGTAGPLTQIQFTVVQAQSLTMAETQLINPLADNAPVLLELRLYPNPASGPVTLHLEGTATGAVRTCLLDLTGRVLREWRTEKEGTNLTLPLDLSGLPAGLYEVQAVVGEARASVRVVKGR